MPCTNAHCRAVPRRIGVITSPTGAAIRDVLSVIARRYPLVEVEILPVPVQGREAAPAIVAMLAAASAAQRHDVLLLTRGGGSLEDLWSFNDEALARAIRASTIPVVSAVGHEIDFTIADFVADLRAATPSAAAELLVPDILAIDNALASSGAPARSVAAATSAFGEPDARSPRRPIAHATSAHAVASRTAAAR